MKSAFTFLSVVLLLLNHQAVAQVQFQKTFDYYSDYMGFNAIMPLAGGGYMVSGGSIATNNNKDAWLVKMNALGDTLWTRSYGDSLGTQNSSRFNAMAQTPGGGFFLAGMSEGFGNSWDYYLVLTDSTGDTLWTRSVNDPMNSVDYCYSGLVANDGNFISFGYRGGFEGDFFLSKNDAAGNILWTKGYSRPGDTDLGYSVYQTTDNGFIMAGATQNSSSDDVLVVKTDSAGGLQWSKTYSGSNFEECRKIVQTQDGGYMIGGTTQSFGAGYKDILLIKTNSSGDTSWTRTLGGNTFDELGSLRQTPDLGYIIVGTSYSVTVGSNQVVMIKTDVSGNLMWSKFYGINGPNIAGKDVALTTDGGYIACGNLSGAGYIIKTDAAGNSGCNENPVTLIQGFAPVVVASLPVNVATGSNLRMPPTSIVRGGQQNYYCLSTGLSAEVSGTLNTVSVYPNPSSGAMHFTLPGASGNGNFELYNLTGMLVRAMLYQSRDFILEKSSLNAGLYFYRITDASGMIFIGKAIFE